ncbi:hypothetical protein [Burkholderia singularis]|uniref:hypothetical protein n=1 Tax=Burkholderia singularis TaxID=1503053 RepID=UPI0011802F82|nr:hypothetical protein [Burkholderia singularis]
MSTVASLNNQPGSAIGRVNLAGQFQLRPAEIDGELNQAARGMAQEMAPQLRQAVSSEIPSGKAQADAAASRRNPSLVSLASVPPVQTTEPGEPESAQQPSSPRNKRDATAQISGRLQVAEQEREVMLRQAAALAQQATTADDQLRAERTNIGLMVARAMRDGDQAMQRDDEGAMRRAQERVHWVRDAVNAFDGNLPDRAAQVLHNLRQALVAANDVLQAQPEENGITDQMRRLMDVIRDRMARLDREQHNQWNIPLARNELDNVQARLDERLQRVQPPDAKRPRILPGHDLSPLK